MRQFLVAALAVVTSSRLYESLPLPESYRAVVVRKDEADMFARLSTSEKDPRRSLHVQEVPLPPTSARPSMPLPPAMIVPRICFTSPRPSPYVHSHA